MEPLREFGSNLSRKKVSLSRTAARTCADVLVLRPAAFLGIPYAEPPLGDLRLRRPQGREGGFKGGKYEAKQYSVFVRFLQSFRAVDGRADRFGLWHFNSVLDSVETKSDMSSGSA